MLSLGPLGRAGTALCRHVHATALASRLVSSHAVPVRCFSSPVAAEGMSPRTEDLIDFLLHSMRDSGSEARVARRIRVEMRTLEELIAAKDKIIKNFEETLKTIVAAKDETLKKSDETLKELKEVVYLHRKEHLQRIGAYHARGVLEDFEKRFGKQRDGGRVEFWTKTLLNGKHLALLRVFADCSGARKGFENAILKDKELDKVVKTIVTDISNVYSRLSHDVHNPYGTDDGIPIISTMPETDKCIIKAVCEAMSIKTFDVECSVA
eukprot:Opistho-2@48124